MHALKYRSLSRYALFLFGLLLILFAFPFFCRFLATALDHGQWDNILAGVTGMSISLMGIPLMVIALQCRHPLDTLDRLMSSVTGQRLCGILLMIVPSQFGWYLLNSHYFPRCPSGPLSVCAPFVVVIFCSLAVSVIGLVEFLYTLIFKTRGLRRQSPS